MDWTEFSAALFDLDGVVTPTADLHMRAWGELFTAVLDQAGVEPYTDDDYFTHLDGKPRYDAVAGLLASRGIVLPYGSPDDLPDMQTVCGLGNRKNDVFNAVIERDGVQPYPGSLALMDYLDSIGIPKAIVSSSRNAPAVLKAAGIFDRFVVVVDGVVAAQRNLPGKPQPYTFAYAAEVLGATPETSVVLEDAVSGVQAGRSGDFGLVVGVDRGAGPEALLEAGADRVVQDLAELIPAQKDA